MLNYQRVYSYMLSRYPEISWDIQSWGKVPGPKRLRYRTLITTLKPTCHAVETSRNILNSQKVSRNDPSEPQGLKGLHEHDHPGSVNGPCAACVAVCNLKLPTWPSSRDLRLSDSGYHEEFATVLKLWEEVKDFGRIDRGWICEFLPPPNSKWHISTTC